MRAVAEHNGCMIMARADSGAVGFACAWIAQDDDPLIRDDARTHAYVSDIFVDQSWRRQGIASLLWIGLKPRCGRGVARASGSAPKRQISLPSPVTAPAAIDRMRLFSRNGSITVLARPRAPAHRDRCRQAALSSAADGSQLHSSATSGDLPREPTRLPLASYCVRLATLAATNFLVRAQGAKACRRRFPSRRTNDYTSPIHRLSPCGTDHHHPVVARRLRNPQGASTNQQCFPLHPST